MKQILLASLLALLPACAHLGLGGSNPEPLNLWEEAHLALQGRAYARADSLFALLAREYPESEPGRESLFYRGTMRLDPRNPSWDPEPAEVHLRRYLATDSVEPGTVRRRPEAETLFQLAVQLNMPGEQRVPGLQPETRVVTREVPVRERVLVRAGEARALAAEAERLRGELNQRDAQIRQLREELERIRRTLSGRRPGN